MLLTKKVKIKYSKSHSHYENLGYIFPDKKSKILVNVEDLSKGSHIKVVVECDFCGKNTERPYKSYLSQRSKHDFDVCKKCNFEKVKLTNMERYGVDVASKNKNIKEKVEKTNMEKYGTKSTTQNEKIKKKIINTWKNKSETEIKEIKNKTEETNLEKYGVKNIFQSEEIKEKIKETNLEKYGVENPFQSEEIKGKIKKTCLEKYGFNHHMNCEEIKDKVRKKFIDSGYMRTYDRKLYDDYAKLVRLKSVDKRKKLLENWDGYDYYDGEYIKDNLKLEPKNLDYPEMDHKISIKFGFDNNISVEDLTSIDNLCFTKKRINSSKSYKTEEEFKENGK